MRAFRLDYFSDAPSAVRTLKLTDLKATLKLFTRDVSASNVYWAFYMSTRQSPSYPIIP